MATELDSLHRMAASGNSVHKNPEQLRNNNWSYYIDNSEVENAFSCYRLLRFSTINKHINHVGNTIQGVLCGCIHVKYLTGFRCWKKHICALINIWTVKETQKDAVKFTDHEQFVIEDSAVCCVFIEILRSDEKTTLKPTVRASRWGLWWWWSLKYRDQYSPWVAAALTGRVADGKCMQFKERRDFKGCVCRWAMRLVYCAYVAVQLK